MSLDLPCKIGGRTTYGMATYNGKRTGVHRCAYAKHHQLSWEELEGKVVMHLCDNPPCAEPTHLVLGTQSDNLADMFNKGRDDRSGDNARNIVVTSDKHVEVLALRAAGYSQREIGRRFGITQSAVSLLLKRITS